MRGLIVLSLVVCAMACMSLDAMGADTWMPHCSFLTKQVVDAHDFARLLRQDRVVAQRFANHYGMSNDAIADLVEQRGRVVIINKPTYFTEYYIDSLGKTHRHRKLLRPGNKMLYVNGTPVLDVRCGNPVSKALPRIPSRPVARVVPPPPPVEAPAPEVEIAEVPPPPPAVTPAPPTPVLPPAVEAVPTPPPTAPAPPVQEVARQGRPFPWWIFPPFLIHFGNGDEEEKPPPPVIPEASSLVLGAGGISFVLTYLRIRRRA